MIVLRGTSSHVLDKAERLLHNALCVLQATVKESRRIHSGGCTKILMAQRDNARLSLFVGAIAIADMAKTTLGPKGMDKILQKVSEHDQLVSGTNNGATILRLVAIDNIAVKVLVNITKVQDNEVGDGMMSVLVLCGEMLREAEHLVQKQIRPLHKRGSFSQGSD